MTDQRPGLADFHRQVLMEDMMETVGVAHFDVVDFDGGKSYVRARANCHACGSKDECRKWLAGNAEGEPQPFCPNANLFQVLKA